MVNSMRKKLEPIQHQEVSTGRKFLFFRNGKKPTRVRVHLFETNGDLIMTAHIFGSKRDPIYRADFSYLTRSDAEKYMKEFCHQCFLNGWFSSKFFSGSVN